jgi:hypothetical protein
MSEHVRYTVCGKPRDVDELVNISRKSLEARNNELRKELRRRESQATRLYQHDADYKAESGGSFLKDDVF